MNPKDDRWRRVERFAVLLVALAAVLPFLVTLEADFVWDDEHLLVNRPDYRDPALFWERWTQGLIFSANYYRPVALLTLHADARLHGLDPAGFHLTNILLHALASALAYLVLRRLFAAAPVGLAAAFALLFAWHPVHVEAVAFVSGRFDLVCTVLFLVALLLGLEAWTAGSPGRAALLAAGSGLAFLLALGAKEMAITLPFVLAACLAWVDRDAASPGGARARLGRAAPLLASLGVALVVYLSARVAGLGHLYRAEPFGPPVGSAIEHLLLVAHSVVRLLRLLVVPWGGLSPLHTAPLPLQADDGAARLSLVLLIAVCGALAWALWKRRSTAWLWLAFAVSLLPVVNIVPLSLGGGSFVAERFAYLPSFLFVVALGPAAAALLRVARSGGFRRVAAGALAAGTLTGCLAGTIVTVPHWSDERTLWTWAARRAPQSDFPWINLGVRAHRERRPAEALECARRALAANPANVNAYDLAGAAHLLLDQPEAAERAFREGLARAPGYVNLWSNLAASLRRQGRLDEAEGVLLNEALPRDARWWTVHFELGWVYLGQGRPEEALTAFDEAWRLVPGEPRVAEGRAEALRTLGRPEEAGAYDR